MAGSDPTLQAYYAARAREYERIYAKPERQADLRKLEQLIPGYFNGRRMLEVACGTGYWTQHLARTAAHVLATDLTDETLAVARTKALPQDRVEFALADAFDLRRAAGPFDGAFAGFWWSHLRSSETDAFLRSLRACLAPAAVVVLLDNRFVPGSSTPISRTDDEGNTWQERRLADGTTHEVVKNFPDRAQLEAKVRGYGRNCRHVELEYYWLFAYESA